VNERTNDHRIDQVSIHPTFDPSIHPSLLVTDNPSNSVVCRCHTRTHAHIGEREEEKKKIRGDRFLFCFGASMGDTTAIFF